MHGKRAVGTLRGVHAAARRVVAYVVPPALRLLCRTAPTAARAPEGGAAEFLFEWVNSSAGVAPASDLAPACSDAVPARLQGELPPMDHYVSCDYDPESSGEWQRRGERGPRGSALFDSGGPCQVLLWQRPPWEIASCAPRVGCAWAPRARPPQRSVLRARRTRCTSIFFSLEPRSTPPPVMCSAAVEPPARPAAAGHVGEAPAGGSGAHVAAHTAMSVIPSHYLRGSQSPTHDSEAAVQLAAQHMCQALSQQQLHERLSAVAHAISSGLVSTVCSQCVKPLVLRFPSAASTVRENQLP